MATCSPIYALRSSPRKPRKLDVEHINVINNNVTPPGDGLRVFTEWYKRLLDGDRNNLGLYLADGVTLRWFGRTIKSKKDVTGFIRYDMNCSNHIFLSANPCSAASLLRRDKDIVGRRLILDDAPQELAVPLPCTPPSICKYLDRFSLRSLSVKRGRSPSSSPEVIRGRSAKKRKDTEDETAPKMGSSEVKYNLRSLPGSPEVKTPKKGVRRSPETSEEPFCKCVEATCVLEFTKVRNKRGADIYKWERKCKLQVAYAEDPVSAGDYMLWKIIYSDDNECKRNLLAAFDAAVD